jgi:hypothetical protein
VHVVAVAVVAGAANAEVAGRRADETTIAAAETSLAVRRDIEVLQVVA